MDIDVSVDMAKEPEVALLSHGQSEESPVLGSIVPQLGDLALVTPPEGPLEETNPGPSKSQPSLPSSRPCYLLC